MVEIPDDVAKREARRLRWLAEQEEQRCGGKGTGESPGLYAIADLLDPQPPSLREQVARSLHGVVYTRDGGVPWDDLHATAQRGYRQEADAVLAVVADWLAAQPLSGWCMTGYLAIGDQQRDHDVRLLRGVSDV